MLLLIPACRAPEPSRSTSEPEPIRWETIKSWSGRGSQHLDSFPSEGALRIEWEATRSPGATTAGSLEIVMHSAISGRPLAAPFVDHAGEGKGTAYVSEEARMFFAVVNSQDIEWKITIAERVR